MCFVALFFATATSTAFGESAANHTLTPVEEVLRSRCPSCPLRHAMSTSLHPTRQDSWQKTKDKILEIVLLQHVQEAQEIETDTGAKYCTRAVALHVLGHLRWPALVMCDGVTQLVAPLHASFAFSGHVCNVRWCHTASGSSACVFCIFWSCFRLLPQSSGDAVINTWGGVINTILTYFFRNMLRLEG